MLHIHQGRRRHVSSHSFLAFMALVAWARSCRSFSVGRSLVLSRARATTAPTATRLFSLKDGNDDSISAAFDELARKEGFDDSLALFAEGSKFDDKSDNSDASIPMQDNDNNESIPMQDNDNNESMEFRIQQAKSDRNQGKVTVSKDMEEYFRELGFEQEENPFGNDESPRNTSRKPVQPHLPMLEAQLVTDPLACSACGSRFQSGKQQKPGYLPPDKFDQQLKFAEWKQRYDINQKAENTEWSADDEVEFLLESAKENEPDEVSEENDQDNSLLDAEMLEMLAKAKPVICKRCHGLQNFGHVENSLRPGWTDDPALQQENFRRLLAPISSKKAVIVALVDLFDFAGSVLPELDWIAGEENPVILAANKADLLPAKLGGNRIENWVRREMEYLGVKSLANTGGAVRLISCKTGAGVRNVLAKAEQLANERESDIYLVGAANSGKSTFLNHILQRTMQKESDEAPIVKKRAGNANKIKGAVTASPLPGTTLQFLRVDLGNGRTLFDTPGLLVPGTITQLLTPEELKIVVPKHRVEPITFRVASGKAVLVGGLAKIELIGECKPFLFTFFVANDIKLHPTDSLRADGFIENHVGGILTPPGSRERYDELGESESHEITIEGIGWKEAAADITLTGLGWVGVMGAGEATVRVTVPKGVGVALRPPLMPFDVWETTARYTGTRSVRKISKAKYGAKKRTKGVGRN